ncbi:MAG: DsbA family oxidoreductase [Bacteroidota bacterium]|jgi:predicted DsbA family dithiol-disulfide isomerase|nr:DsbA family oxidoreductase [Bacteroidota bacterium]
MKVEIWSDVMCPFCYIGKRKFEKALEQFPHKDKITVIWKSYQLDPDSVTDTSLNAIDHLAHRKGWSKEQANEATQHVSGIAKEVGLEFHFEKAVVANSFDAHRLSHLAKKYNKQNDLEEKLFAAYFTEGKNTGDYNTLLQIGKELNIDEKEITDVLNSEAFANEVNHDIMEAQQIGVRGVPFFVIDRKYAVSGAQEPDTFLNALTKAFEEHTPN